MSPRQHPVAPTEELRAFLQEAAVTDAPTTAPHGDDAVLQGLLALALHVADFRKRVAFPSFAWDDPRFVAVDDKVTLDFAFAPLIEREPAKIAEALLAQLPRVGRRTLLALDARASGLKEFEFEHILYGSVTLFAHRHRPSEAADHRIDTARERGWVKTLKEHNLLPGRGLVVLDENQGLILREPRFESLLGLLVLFPSGGIQLMWNPFAKESDSELQYWPAWGPGGVASAWRELFRADENQE